jgi:hypothetical protein
MLASQVAGLYNPDDKKLYVVSRSGRIGALEKATFSHEFTHALQDQNFDLGSLKLDEIGQGDRSFARLALVEGDATLAMTYWEIQNLTTADLGELLQQAQTDPSTAQLAALPAILRESLLFPYVQGLTFVQGLQSGGGWRAVDSAFAKPPASTEQILHPDKYTAGEQPDAVTLPSDLAAKVGSGWSAPVVDTLRGVPARRLARGCARDEQGHGGRRGGGLGRRPDRGASRPRTAPGASSLRTAWGQRERRERVRGGGASRSSTGWRLGAAAARRRRDGAVGPRRLGRRDLSRIAGASASPADVRGRADRPYIDSGR